MLSSGRKMAESGPHLVITLHGIRTYGEWQTRLEKLVHAKNPEIVFSHFRYGYFSAVAFLIPMLRRILVGRFERELLHKIDFHKPTRIDLVGHSFGTYIIGWTLRRLRNKQSEIRFHTVILAGSVLKTNHHWGDIVGFQVVRLINDCGENDDVLLVSQLVVGTGMAGRLGFIGMHDEQFVARFSKFGHGGYFGPLNNDDTYMKENWVPLLTGNEPINKFDSRETPTPIGGLKLWLLNNSEPLKISIYVAPFFVAALAFFSLWIGNELYKQRLQALVSLTVAFQARGGQDRIQVTSSVLSAIRAAASLRIEPTYGLWVDDMGSSQNLSEIQAFERFSICFDTARTSRAALSMLQADPSRYSVILSDFRRDNDPEAFRLGGNQADGFRLLEQVRQSNVPTPFIFYVGPGNDNSEWRSLAIARGAQGQTSDPFELLTTVLTALRPRSADLGSFGFWYPLRAYFFQHCDRRGE